MDEKPDQIMSHIESQRDQLGRNLNELENRVKGATDWRVQFDKNPMLMMGVAVGGGLLLGSIVAGGKKSSSSRSSWSSSSKYSSSPTNMGSTSYGSGAQSYGSGSQQLSSAGSSSSYSSSSPALREQRRKATDTLEHIKAALIGFATAKVKEFMTEALPGFNQHLDEAERRQTGGQQQYGSGSGSGSYQQSGGGYGSGSQSGSSGSPYGSSSQGSQGQGSQGQGSQGSQSGTPAGSQQATTRTEHSANSPYAGQTTGLNI